MTEKPILDATCGGRMMWFNKRNPHCLYVDNRYQESMRIHNNRVHSVLPDMVADFRALPFDEGSFMLVVFDPPHLRRAGESSYMGIKYGKLPADWQAYIHDGFWECMRVLGNYGTLIFKWSEVQISTRDVINAIGAEPLFGHISGRKMNTHWMTFMKLPGEGG